MIRIQASISPEAGVGEGTFVNTFHIGHDTGYTPSVAEMDVLLAEVRDFYIVAPGGGFASSLASFYAPWVQEGNALLVKGYWKEGVGPGLFGAPVSQIVANMPAQSATVSLPAHLAAVLTLEGEGAATAPVELAGPPVTRPKKRRRGRLYLGPLGLNALTSPTDSDAEIDTEFSGTAMAALNKLCDDVDAITAGSPYVGVWSRADQEVYRVVAGSMDDRFDVMDTRKRLSGTRTTTPV